MSRPAFPSCRNEECCAVSALSHRVFHTVVSCRRCNFRWLFSGTLSNSFGIQDVVFTLHMADFPVDRQKAREELKTLKWQSA
jgi:hypothetical protein